MNDQHTEVVVHRKPDKCSFCSQTAVYDGATRMGAWAYMCEQHFAAVGRGLGLGKGQKLIYRPPSKTRGGHNAESVPAPERPGERLRPVAARRPRRPGLGE